jgi:hypothetical protein
VYAIHAVTHRRCFCARRTVGYGAVKDIRLLKPCRA